MFIPHRARRHRLATLRSLVATFGFPFLIVASVGGSIAAIRSGIEPALTVIVAITSAYVWLADLERLVPYRAAWGRSHGDLGTDGAWFVPNSVLNRLFEPPLLGATPLAPLATD